MKKSNLLIILSLSFSSFVFCQKDSIIVEKAPANLPLFEEGWQETVQNDLNTEDLPWFFKDPNYFAGQISGSYSYYKAPLTKILTSETLANTFYNWLIAPLKILWNNLSNTSKANLRDIIVHCSEYANKFSLVNENNYLKATKTMAPHEFGESNMQFHRPIGGQDYFTRWDPQTDFFDKDFKKPIPEVCRSKYRKLDAIIYRRVKNGANIKVIQNIFKKLLIDFPFDITGTFEEKGENSLTKTSFKAGKRDGIWIYQENDIVVDSGLYVNNLKEGVWKNYDSYEKIHLPRLVDIYKNGKLQERTFTEGENGIVNYKIWFNIGMRKYIISQRNSTTNNLEVLFQAKFY
jgi:hypothetical protein